MPTLKKESMVYPSVQDKNLGFRRVLIFCPVLRIYRGISSIRTG
jgi:hypothetical protein